MGRELRMVPPGWHHPIEFARDRQGYMQIHHIPLLGGSYSKSSQKWDEDNNQWNLGFVDDYKGGYKAKTDESIYKGSYEDYEGPRPVAEHYMPEFPPGTATYFMMYENVTEGTPISPSFATPHELAMWLSSFWRGDGNYQQWLRIIEAGSSPSLIVYNGVVESGVKHT